MERILAEMDEKRIIEIALTQGKTAIIDEGDAQRVLILKWRAFTQGTNWYAVAYVRGSGAKNPKTVYLHRFILDAPSGVQVDHINGDGLDCRRSNMRFVNNQQNHWNMKGRGRYRGVYVKGDKWISCIIVHGKQRQLGTFDTELEAALHFDNAAREHYGEYARFNFPGTRLWTA